MIQAIEQRRQTMLKVMNFIVDRQREFFEKGVEYLKPLTLREVADVINMHESTDRKSTRLNSSHANISYAVFCLKKKKKRKKKQHKQQITENQFVQNIPTSE